jgi:hypothetical protein|tara:strand:- start:7390 stop:7818 length:429 start_codon:yes stop_codon:yes gene_type:complete
MTTQPIKIVKLANGDDIVCSFPKDQLTKKSHLLRLEKPLHIKYVPQLTPGGFKDYVALIKWAPYTQDHIISIPKDKILTITNANTDMIKSYYHVAANYDKELKVPEKKDFERVRFSNKENEKINEIFEDEELDDYDDNGTLH